MKKHILLVEDNERLRSNLLFVLNKEGFDAVGAVNGTEALELIAKTPPDLVVSDIMMPDMDGYDLVKHLRETPETISLPVIFLTAKTAPEEQRSGMLFGVDDYLTKPVNINDLLATINVRLERAEKQKKKWIANLNHLQTHLASILPHELRTPVSGIMGASSFLRMSMDSLAREDVEELHSCIEDSAARLARIAENFLLYVQLQILLEDQANEEEPNIEREQYRMSNVREYIEDIATSVANKYNRLPLLHLTLEDATINCSPAHFHKALAEVLENAFQFSPKETPVEIVSENTGSVLLISITDYGRGISEEQIETLKEYPTVFKQFDRRKFEQQGVGMGLVLVYNILKLYDGTMTIKSELGHSTTVCLEFHLVESGK